MRKERQVTPLLHKGHILFRQKQENMLSKTKHNNGNTCTCNMNNEARNEYTCRYMINVIGM